MCPLYITVDNISLIKGPLTYLSFFSDDEAGVTQATKVAGELCKVLDQQFAALTSATVMHTEKRRQLMALRSQCYFTGIVPGKKCCRVMF